MSAFENILKIGEKSLKSLLVFKDMNDFQKGFLNFLGNCEILRANMFCMLGKFLSYTIFLSKTNEQLAIIM